MPGGYFRTGPAAKKLGVSSYHIRRLCEVGEIAAEITDGQQWKLPASEIARLQREGLPELPVELEDDPGKFKDTAFDGGGPDELPDGLLASPSAELIGAAEEVKIVASRLQKRKIEREAEEVEDWFRDRERRQAAISAAEQQRAAAAQAEQRRRKWLDSWIQYALNSRHYGAPRETELDIHQAVQTTLASSPPDQPLNTTQRLVNAAVEKVLRPWKQKQEIRAAIESAVNRLHADIVYRSEWAHFKQRALEAAAAAVAKLQADCTRNEMDAVAALAVQPMAKEHAHVLACRSLAAWITLPGTSAEDRDAREAVSEALARLPVGTPQKELENWRGLRKLPWCRFGQPSNAAKLRSNAARTRRIRSGTNCGN